jgi:hypothetical protein
MRALHRYAAITTLFCALPCASQIVTPKLGDAIKVTGNADRAIYKVGEDVEISIHLSNPAPRLLSMSGQTHCGFFVIFAGSIEKGAREGVLRAKLQGQLMNSISCSLDSFQIAPPPRVDDGPIVLPTTLTFPRPIAFEVIGRPSVEDVMPGPFTGQIELSERQFLRGRAVPLRELRNALTSSLDQHAGDSVELDSRLLDALTSARSDLEAARKDFVQRYRQNSAAPVYFDDLDRRYQALIIDVTAHKTKLAAANEPTPRWVTVQQLRPRPNDSVPPPDDGYPRLSGTIPPDAYESLDLLEWNIAVFERVANSGEETFSISLVTLPPDATVEAKRIGEEYVLLGGRTTIPKVTFGFAIWTFRFTKPNCKTQIQRYDPIRDTSPSVSVELSCDY